MWGVFFIKGWYPGLAQSWVWAQPWLHFKAHRVNLVCGQVWGQPVPIIGEDNGPLTSRLSRCGGPPLPCQNLPLIASTQKVGLDRMLLIRQSSCDRSGRRGRERSPFLPPSMIHSVIALVILPSDSDVNSNFLTTKRQHSSSIWVLSFSCLFLFEALLVTVTKKTTRRE